MTRRTLLAAAAGLAVLWGLWYFFPTKARQVRRQFKALASWMSKDGEEGALAIAQQAREAGRFVGPSCHVESETYDIDGEVTPEDVARYYFAAHTRASAISLKFYDLAITFPDDETARAIATARLTVTPKEGDATTETHEVDCTLKKADGRWLLRRVSLVQVLRK